jgi:N-formylglutamate deformylase
MKAFFVSIPHSGEKVPAEAEWLHGLPEPILMCDVDRYVDRLYQAAVQQVGCPVIMTEWHRFVVDLNRLPDDIDVDSVQGAKNPSGSFPRGLHWIRTTKAQPIMTKPMTMQKHLDFVRKYFEPFHLQVRTSYDGFRKKGYPTIYHLDAHSMPSMGTKEHKDPGQKRADIVVSDCEGKSCDTSYKDLVMESYKRAGFEVAYNWPYVGGRVTETYGKPKEGQQAIQVELNRALYMNEENKQYNVVDAANVAKKITTALTSIVEGLPGTR